MLRPLSGLTALLAIVVVAGSGIIAGCGGDNWPSPAPSTLFFDDFNGGLSSSWTVLRPDAVPSNLYSFPPPSTYLDVQCSNGTLTFHNNNYNNAFLIDNPTAGDFIATMRVLSFSPQPKAYHQIAILAYDDDDNYARAIYGYIYGERDLQLVTEVSAAFTNDSHVAQDFGTDPFYLRLTKTGDQYRQYYSTDGNAWTLANGPFAYGHGTPLKIGFIACDGENGDSHAHIDWFKVEAG